MIFKKPYAFFIKYFRLINLILTTLTIYTIYRMNLLYKVVSNIFSGRINDFGILESTYIGSFVYFIIIVINIILVVLIVTLKRKGKTYKDYLLNFIYNIILFFYFYTISRLFSSLNEGIVEITSLKLYKDISFLIILPMFYFIIKYILIVIGFDLKKFDFSKDIISMQHDDKDSEEVEIIFGKNNYIYKRKVRKYFRELKYYVLENKYIISVIITMISFILIISFFSNNIFTNNKVKLNKMFSVENMTFKVNKVYETKYDYNNKIIKDGFKFVIANITITNNYFESLNVDFNNFMIFYNGDYVMANNYYNDYFSDLGNSYNKEFLKSNETRTYNFIFKIPLKYKSNKYTFKFYDGLKVKNNETIANYKILKCRAIKLDKKVDLFNYKLQQTGLFGKNYGKSNIIIEDFSFVNSYEYNDGIKDVIIYDKNANNTLLVIDYKINFDDKQTDYIFIKDHKDFFEKYSTISFSFNGKNKTYKNLNILSVYDNKVIIGVPSKVLDSKELIFTLELRHSKLDFILN